MKLGIGARITAVFGLGALILSILMGGLSYFTVRHFLLAGRESAAQHQAFNNAVLVRTSLQQGTKPQQYVGLLANIDAGSDAHSVLYHRAKAYESSLSVSASIPVQLRTDVLKGTAATQTYRTAQGTAEIGVGIPIPSVHAFYFEVFDLSDLDHTLRVLGLTLFVAGVVTTLLGTGLGRFASVRSLRPLADVSRAASAIAGGELDTRLDADAADPDLEGLTNSFNAMVDQLQERIEREARFNSDVSHELRSPLTTLAAALEVLEADRDDLSTALPAGLATAERRPAALPAHGRRTCSRCRGPTPVRSTSSWRRSASPSWCSARSRRGSRTWWPTGRGAPRTCTSTPPYASWRVGVDKRRFERVMVNLMENADHYGGGATAIAVGPDDDMQVEVIVDDDGPGIDPLERLKIFERFYRGSASGRRGTGTGTGLGLALVAEHMHVMHGSVRVESSDSGGARFVLTLPVLADGDEPGEDE